VAEVRKVTVKHGSS